MIAFNYNCIPHSYGVLFHYSQQTDNMVPLLEKNNITLLSAEIFQNDPKAQVENLAVQELHKYYNN